jgi:multiple sugar transport system permease protein
MAWLYDPCCSTARFRARVDAGALLIPLMLPPVISGTMWKTMLAPARRSTISQSCNYAWFANPWSARFVVIFIEVWSSTPFVALVLLSGLQSLPKEPFEAARVDGAHSWFILRRLMMPMLQPFLLIVLLFRVVDVLSCLTSFSPTSGGPMYTTTITPILVYKEVFKSYTWARLCPKY